MLSDREIENTKELVLYVLDEIEKAKNNRRTFGYKPNQYKDLICISYRDTDESKLKSRVTYLVHLYKENYVNQQVLLSYLEDGSDDELFNLSLTVSVDERNAQYVVYEIWKNIVFSPDIEYITLNLRILTEYNNKLIMENKDALF